VQVCLLRGKLFRPYYVKDMEANPKKGVLGLTGHYHQFIKKYGSIAGPLKRLLKKWTF